MPNLFLGHNFVNYEEYGQGPAIVLIPGLRNGLAAMRPTALGLQNKYRTILFDRYNCGASDVCFEGEGAEAHLWADQLVDLLDTLNAWPVHLAGYSLGGNIALLVARKRPAQVLSVFLGWVTGGAFPRERLAQELYGQFLAAAAAGGMPAVSATAYFQQLIRENSRNLTLLLETDPVKFVSTMRRWSETFHRPSKATPLEDFEIQITQPTLIVAGDDEIHLTEAAAELHRSIASSVYVPPLIAKAEWLKFKSHQEIAAWRGIHVPPIYLKFLSELGVR